MSHTWLRHVTHMTASCHTHDWVMSHTWLSHVTHMNESSHTHEWDMSRHVTHEWVASPDAARWSAATSSSSPPSPPSPSNLVDMSAYMQMYVCESEWMCVYIHANWVSHVGTWHLNEWYMSQVDKWKSGVCRMWIYIGTGACVRVWAYEESYMDKWHFNPWCLWHVKLKNGCHMGIRVCDIMRVGSHIWINDIYINGVCDMWTNGKTFVPDGYMSVTLYVWACVAYMVSHMEKYMPLWHAVVFYFMHMWHTPLDHHVSIFCLYHMCGVGVIFAYTPEYIECKLVSYTYVRS